MEHVQALNSIDLAFDRKKNKEKAVVDAWASYLDQLYQEIDQTNPATVQSWNDRNNERFIDLLEALSEVLGYEFTRVHLMRGIYYPRGHSEAELAQLSIRDSLVKVLSGQQSIPMAVTHFPYSEEASDLQKKVNEAVIESLSDKRILKVSIVNPC